MQKYPMEVIVMLFTYPTNCHTLRFNANRHIVAFLVKKGRKRVMSQINEEIFLTSILAEFLKNAKISHGSRSYVVYLSNKLSHPKIQYKTATLWPSL